jgi:hypothetical protein
VQAVCRSSKKESAGSVTTKRSNRRPPPPLLEIRKRLAVRAIAMSSVDAHGMSVPYVQPFAAAAMVTLSR